MTAEQQHDDTVSAAELEGLHRRLDGQDRLLARLVDDTGSLLAQLPVLLGRVALVEDGLDDLAAAIGIEAARTRQQVVDAAAEPAGAVTASQLLREVELLRSGVGEALRGLYDWLVEQERMRRDDAAGLELAVREQLDGAEEAVVARLDRRLAGVEEASRLVVTESRQAMSTLLEQVQERARAAAAATDVRVDRLAVRLSGAFEQVTARAVERNASVLQQVGVQLTESLERLASTASGLAGVDERRQRNEAELMTLLRSVLEAAREAAPVRPRRVGRLLEALRGGQPPAASSARRPAEPVPALGEPAPARPAEDDAAPVPPVRPASVRRRRATRPVPSQLPGAAEEADPVAAADVTAGARPEDPIGTTVDDLMQWPGWTAADSPVEPTTRGRTRRALTGTTQASGQAATVTPAGTRATGVAKKRAATPTRRPSASPARSRPQDLPDEVVGTPAERPAEASAAAPAGKPSRTAGTTVKPTAKTTAKAPAKTAQKAAARAPAKAASKRTTTTPGAAAAGSPASTAAGSGRRPAGTAPRKAAGKAAANLSSPPKTD